MLVTRITEIELYIVLFRRISIIKPRYLSERVTVKYLGVVVHKKPTLE